MNVKHLLQNPAYLFDKHYNSIQQPVTQVQRPAGVKKENPFKKHKQPIKLKQYLEQLTAPDKDVKIKPSKKKIVLIKGDEQQTIAQQQPEPVIQEKSSSEDDDEPFFKYEDQDLKPIFRKGRIKDKHHPQIYKNLQVQVQHNTQQILDELDDIEIELENSPNNKKLNDRKFELLDIINDDQKIKHNAYLDKKLRDIEKKSGKKNETYSYLSSEEYKKNIYPMLEQSEQDIAEQIIKRNWKQHKHIMILQKKLVDLLGEDAKEYFNIWHNMIQNQGHMAKSINRIHIGNIFKHEHIPFEQSDKKFKDISNISQKNKDRLIQRYMEVKALCYNNPDNKKYKQEFGRLYNIITSMAQQKQATLLDKKMWQQKNIPNKNKHLISSDVLSQLYDITPCMNNKLMHDSQIKDWIDWYELKYLQDELIEKHKDKKKDIEQIFVEWIEDINEQNKDIKLDDEDIRNKELQRFMQYHGLKPVIEELSPEKVFVSQKEPQSEYHDIPKHPEFESEADFDSDKRKIKQQLKQQADEFWRFVVQQKQRNSIGNYDLIQFLLNYVLNDKTNKLAQSEQLKQQFGDLIKKKSTYNKQEFYEMINKLHQIVDDLPYKARENIIDEIKEEIKYQEAVLRSAGTSPIKQKTTQQIQQTSPSIDISHQLQYEQLKIGELKNQLNSNQKQNNALLFDIIKLKDEINNKNNKIDQLNDQVLSDQGMQVDLKLKKKEILELTDQNQKQQQQLEIKQKQLEDFKQDYDKLWSDKQIMDNLYDDIKIQKNQLQLEKIQLTSQIKQQEQQITEHLLKLKQGSNDIDQQDKQLKQMMANLQLLQHQNKKYEEQIKLMQELKKNSEQQTMGEFQQMKQKIGTIEQQKVDLFIDLQYLKIKDRNQQELIDQYIKQLQEKDLTIQQLNEIKQNMQQQMPGIKQANEHYSQVQDIVNNKIIDNIIVQLSPQKSDIQNSQIQLAIQQSEQKQIADDFDNLVVLNAPEEINEEADAIVYFSELDGAVDNNYKLKQYFEDLKDVYQTNYMKALANKFHHATLLKTFINEIHKYTGLSGKPETKIATIFVIYDLLRYRPLQQSSMKSAVKIYNTLFKELESLSQDQQQQVYQAIQENNNIRKQLNTKVKYWLYQENDQKLNIKFTINIGD